MKMRETWNTGGAKSAGVGLVLVVAVGALAGYGLYGFLGKKSPAPKRGKKTYTRILRKPMPKPSKKGAALEMKLTASAKKRARPKKAAPRVTKPRAAKKPEPRLAKRPEPRVEPGALSRDIWVVQVGAFRNKESATNLSGKLAKEGFKTFVNAWNHPRYGDMYRIRVGPILSKEGALRTKERLVERGFKPFIVKNP